MIAFGCKSSHVMSALALQIRGNPRAKREDVLGLVVEGVEKLFGESTPSCTPGFYITTPPELSFASKGQHYLPITRNSDTVSQSCHLGSDGALVMRK